MLGILSALGCRTEMRDDRVMIDTSPLIAAQIPEDLMGQMRSSIFLMGPLLARFGQVYGYKARRLRDWGTEDRSASTRSEALGAKIQFEGGIDPLYGRSSDGKRHHA